MFTIQKCLNAIGWGYPQKSRKRHNNKQLDLGHVILSKYQDDDIDREALEAMVDYVFRNKEVVSIVTRNDSHHKEQIAPLKALGLKNVNENDKGEFVITKAEWEA